MKRLIGLILLVALFGLAAAQSVEVLEETSEYRLVKHVMGETRIPATPKRIVSLTSAVTEGMIALNLTPVGVIPTSPGGHRTYLLGALSDIPTMSGDEYTLNLEAILALEPDLILLYAFNGNLVTNVTYEQLSSIAPTVALDWERLYSDFRAGFLDLGNVLGKRGDAEARLTEYERELAETRAALQNVMGNETIAVLRVTARDLRLQGGIGLTGPLLYDDLGLRPAELVRDLAIDEEFVSLSLEALPQLDADHLLIVTVPGDEAALNELQGSGLWQTIPAVRQEQIYLADYDIWITNGILANKLALDEFRTFITQSD